MSNSSHEYRGERPSSRAVRTLSKLGPGIVTAERLEELLREAEHMETKDEG
jgi:hypothetical protein